MKKGFTLIEMVIVMGIFISMAAMGSVNFFATHSGSSLESTKNIMLADIRSQQSRAMSGEGQSGALVSSWGVKILPSQYTLFAGPTYNVNNATNTVIAVPNDITLSSSFPNSGEILFARGTGEIVGFASGQDSITITLGSESKVLRFNKYGVIIGD